MEKVDIFPTCYTREEKSRCRKPKLSYFMTLSRECMTWLMISFFVAGTSCHQPTPRILCPAFFFPSNSHTWVVTFFSPRMTWHARSHHMRTYCQSHRLMFVFSSLILRLSRFAGLLEEPVNSLDSSATRKAKDFYLSCMNLSKLSELWIWDCQHIWI